MKTRLLALLILVAMPVLSRACSIPVFRYALERWELAPYEITVFYEKQLPPQFEKLLKTAEAAAPKANVMITRVDLAGKFAPEYTKLWARQPAQKPLPWLVAWRPDADANLPDAWSGPLTEENLRRLLDSPARQQLVDKLSHGTTAVFLVLAGADEAANAKAVALLDKELPRLAKQVQLPEPSPEGPQIRTGVPLKVEFAVLKLKRADPGEQALIRSLLSSEKELAKVQGPIVLPVFGRGRVLCSLFGDDLNLEALKGVVRFMCGECSCQLKELNPGTDLLIAADWQDLLQKAGPPLPRVAVQQAAVETKPGAVPTTTQAPAQEVVAAIAPPAVQARENEVVLPSVAVPSESSEDCCPIARHFWLVSGIAGAGVLVLITGICVFMQKK